MLHAIAQWNCNWTANKIKLSFDDIVKGVMTVLFRLLWFAVAVQRSGYAIQRPEEKRRKIILLALQCVCVARVLNMSHRNGL